MTLADLVVRHVEHVLVSVGQVEVVAGDAGDGLGGDALEAPDPVVLVHHVVTLAQVAEAGQLHRHRRARHRRLVPAREDEGVGKHRQLQLGDDEVPAQRHRQERHPRARLDLAGGRPPSRPGAEPRRRPAPPRPAARRR